MPTTHSRAKELESEIRVKLTPDQLLAFDTLLNHLRGLGETVGHFPASVAMTLVSAELLSKMPTSKETANDA